LTQSAKGIGRVRGVRACFGIGNAMWIWARGSGIRLHGNRTGGEDVG